MQWVVGSWRVLVFYPIFHKYINLPRLKMLSLKQFQKSFSFIYEDKWHKAIYW